MRLLCPLPCTCMPVKASYSMRVPSMPRRIRRRLEFLYASSSGCGGGRGEASGQLSGRSSLSEGGLMCEGGPAGWGAVGWGSGVGRGGGMGVAPEAAARWARWSV